MKRLILFTVVLSLLPSVHAEEESDSVFVSNFYSTSAKADIYEWHLLSPYLIAHNIAMAGDDLFISDLERSRSWAIKASPHYLVYSNDLDMIVFLETPQGRKLNIIYFFNPSTGKCTTASIDKRGEVFMGMYFESSRLVVSFKDVELLYKFNKDRVPALTRTRKNKTKKFYRPHMPSFRARLQGQNLYGVDTWEAQTSAVNSNDVKAFIKDGSISIISDNKEKLLYDGSSGKATSLKWSGTGSYLAFTVVEESPFMEDGSILCTSIKLSDGISIMKEKIPIRMALSDEENLIPPRFFWFGDVLFMGDRYFGALSRIMVGWFEGEEPVKSEVVLISPHFLRNLSYTEK